MSGNSTGTDAGAAEHVENFPPVESAAAVKSPPVEMEAGEVPGADRTVGVGLEEPVLKIEKEESGGEECIPQDDEMAVINDDVRVAVNQALDSMGLSLLGMFPGQLSEIEAARHASVPLGGKRLGWKVEVSVRARVRKF